MNHSQPEFETVVYHVRRFEFEAAVSALEERVHHNPMDREAVTQLIFCLWLFATEWPVYRPDQPVPEAEWEERFGALIEEYEGRFSYDADFCWACGLGLSATCGNEERANELLQKAYQLDTFWDDYYGGKTSNEQERVRFQGRGPFELYFLDEAAR
jgi:hypothetical protein